MERIKNSNAVKAVKKFFSKPIPGAFLALAGWIAVMIITMVIADTAEGFLSDRFWFITPVSMILMMILYLLWIRKRLGGNFVIGFRLDNLGKSLAMCAAAFAVILAVNLEESIKVFWTTPMELSPAEAFGALIKNVIVGMQPGVTEEGICRVILMGVMMHLSQGRKNRLALAVGLSSGIFGLLHLINIFSGAPVVETLFQVMYATAIGLMFAAVYARTRNIIATMIVHSLVDASADFYVRFYPNLSSASQQTTQGMTMKDVVIQVGITVLCLGLGLYLLRPAKRHEIEEHWGSLDAAKEAPAV